MSNTIILTRLLIPLVLLAIVGLLTQLSGCASDSSYAAKGAGGGAATGASIGGVLYDQYGNPLT